MLLIDLREDIETGKIAKLLVPKTHEHGIELTITVLKKDDGYIWQREKIEDLNLPAITRHFEKWDDLVGELRGSMQLRDTTWEACEELIESEEGKCPITSPA